MTDVIGLAASIGGLVDIAFRIASALYQYTLDVKGAPEQSEQLRKELGDLQTVCKIVEKSVKVKSAEGLPEALENQVAGFKAILENMLKRTTPKKTSGIQKLKWPLSKSENAKCIENIERFKSTLNLILNMDQTYRLPLTRIDI